MTEFKQIIGRGTRINEEYGKTYFTIIDFRNVTDLFADPDFDGVPNLEEYGFGGDPSAWGDVIAGTAHPMLPRIAGSGTDVVFSFPRRTDAGDRGLSYIVEWSDTLAAGSWTSVAPDGATVSSEPWDPAVDGFERVLVEWPDSGPRFCRVRIEMDE
jgi:hypothetical protein